MNNIKVFLLIFFAILLFSYGCNILPKSVQYQKEEEKLIGNIDVINPVVNEIQVILSSLGYDTGNTDGRIGQKTRQAIREFQESIGIRSTGYINKNTLNQIEDIRRTSKKDLEIPEPIEYTVEVRSGFSKPTTKEIQISLKNAGFDPGAVDGKMGPRTKQAVKEFQRAKELKPDGVVGPKTWEELEKYLNISN